MAETIYIPATNGGRPASKLPDAHSERPGGAARPAKVGISLETKELALTGTENRSVDPAALVALYETHGERMKSIAMNLLGRRADAEDAVQEAFLRMFRGASRFRGGASLSTWAYRILVNACYDILRRSKRRPETSVPDEEALPAGRPEDHPLRLAIEKALSHLEERERTAFVLCEIEGLSHREAGEVLDVNENTSRTLLFRAKRRLQKTLREAGAIRPAEAP